MNETVALRLLSSIMGWDDDRSREEFTWLRLMARFKYDDYQAFFAGVRFTESLAKWLQQFDIKDRQCAYDFIRNKLVYISATEMNHLVELFYLSEVQPCIQKAVSVLLGKPNYMTWATSAGLKEYRTEQRKTLFMALSDGARLDHLRRHQAGVLSNEQMTVGTQLDNEKWRSLLTDLRKDLEDPTASFSRIFLIDDFVGSGTTLIRRGGDGWSGKLKKTWDSLKKAKRDVVKGTLLTEDWVLHVHHHVATDIASKIVKERHQEALMELGRDGWFERVEFSFGYVLPETLPITRTGGSDMVRLIDNYYDPGIENPRHMEASGTKTLHYGYGECGLPLILEHNTPNNSIALLWAESEGGGCSHQMRPLFRRRQRHT